MIRFLADQTDYILFIGGFTALLLAILLWGQVRRDDGRLPWRALVWFALLQCTYLWLEMLALGIDDWLAGQAPDSRLQLTIIAHYTPANAAGAAATALQMADAARAGGWPARIMLEPGQTDDALAVLGYDNAADMAR